MGRLVRVLEAGDTDLLAGTVVELLAEAARRYDDEGLAARCNPLVDGGVRGLRAVTAAKRWQVRGGPLTQEVASRLGAPTVGGEDEAPRP